MTREDPPAEQLGVQQGHVQWLGGFLTIADYNSVTHVFCGHAVRPACRNFASSSAGTRTHLPTFTAGSRLAHIHRRTVICVTFNNSLTSATVFMGIRVSPV